MFYETILKSDDEKALLAFFSKHPVTYYMLRDKSKFNSNVGYYNLTKEEVLDKYKNFELYSIDVSPYNFEQNKILMGDIFISRDNSLMITASSSPDCNRRDYPAPNWIFASDVFDKKLKGIPGIKYLLDYIYKYKLFDIVVEFTIFDIPVGIKHEHVVIYELRTDY